MLDTSESYEQFTLAYMRIKGSRLFGRVDSGSGTGPTSILNVAVHGVVAHEQGPGQASELGRGGLQVFDSAASSEAGFKEAAFMLLPCRFDGCFCPFVRTIDGTQRSRQQSRVSRLSLSTSSLKPYLPYVPILVDNIHDQMFFLLMRKYNST